MRGATSAVLTPPITSIISIHAPHARSDGITKAWTPSRSSDFNPRSSCEERLLSCAKRRRGRYFNPRSSCEERPARLKETLEQLTISIHAPHARSDDNIRIKRYNVINFNPRSSCEERRVLPVVLSVSFTISIHAPHARSDTACATASTSKKISIHAPHARSDDEVHRLGRRKNISIHAPHARSDVSFL